MPMHARAVRSSSTPASTRRTRLRILARWVWLVGILVFGIDAVASRWSAMRDAAAGLNPVVLTASALAAALGVAVSFIVWRELLVGLGARAPLRHAAGIFFVGQLSKYVPGTFWPVVAQMHLGRDYGIRRQASAAAVALFLVVHLLTGIAVAATVLPIVGLAPPGAALAIAGCAMLIHPAVWNRAAAGMNRVLRRPLLPDAPPVKSMLRAIAAALVMWASYGLHLYLAATAFGMDIPLVQAVGVFAGAWVAGFVVVVAPAGAGVRELAMTSLLSATGPTNVALIVVLVSRLLLTMADVVWGAIAAVISGVLSPNAASGGERV